MQPRARSDYSLSFLYPVWVADSYGTLVPNSALEQTSNPMQISFRFANTAEFGDSPERDCTTPYGPLMQAMQRDIFSGLTHILPSHVKFTEFSAAMPADINIVTCNKMDWRYGGQTNPPKLGGSVLGMSNRISFETSLKISNWLMLSLPQQVIRMMIAHETGHALGLKHTHTTGEWGNSLNITGYTLPSSIMSYDFNTMVTLQAFFGWQHLFPKQDFGLIDIANLKYAYDLNAPSLAYQALDADYVQNFYRPESLVIMPLSIIPLSAQMALGMSLALIQLLIPILAQKAKARDYHKIAAILDKIENFFLAMMPAPKSAISTRGAALKNAAMDVAIAVPRIVFPAAALAYDTVFNIGMRSQYGTTRCIRNSAFLIETFESVCNYSLLRLFSFPTYSLFTFAKTQQEVIHAANTPRREVATEENKSEAKPRERIDCTRLLTKILVSPLKLLSHVRGVQYLVTGTRFKIWMDSIKVIQPVTPSYSAVRSQTLFGNGAGDLHIELMRDLDSPRHLLV